MKMRSVLFISAIFLLVIAGGVSATETTPADTGVATNVWFCKLIKTGNSYELEPLPTMYVGKNDYGRLMFITGSKNIESGDYAVVQTTAEGTELIETLTITKGGTETPEYTMLTLEFQEEALPAPLEFKVDAEETATETPTTAPETSATTTAKSPVGIPAVLAGVMVAGILTAMRFRR
jgi:hypothetical protein